ncbi:MAG: DUF1127 domain-containing protein [Pseudomonadota bacterium]
MKTDRMVNRAEFFSLDTFAGLFNLISMWRVRARSRADLALLTQSQLDDIGVTAHQAGVEAAKPFWQA